MRRWSRLPPWAASPSLTALPQPGVVSPPEATAAARRPTGRAPTGSPRSRRPTPTRVRCRRRARHLTDCPCGLVTGAVPSVLSAVYVDNVYHSFVWGYLGSIILCGVLWVRGRRHRTGTACTRLLLPASECQPARVLLEPCALFAFCVVLAPRAIQSRVRRSRGHGRLLQRQLSAVEAWMELSARVPRPPSLGLAGSP